MSLQPLLRPGTGWWRVAEIIAVAMGAAQADMASLPFAVRQQLNAHGMSELGITQLFQGQPITHPNDRGVLAALMRAALGG